MSEKMHLKICFSLSRFVFSSYTCRSSEEMSAFEDSWLKLPKINILQMRCICIWKSNTDSYHRASNANSEFNTTENHEKFWFEQYTKELRAWSTASTDNKAHVYCNGLSIMSHWNLITSHRKWTFLSTVRCSCLQLQLCSITESFYRNLH